jgi:hypothetical protein
MAHQIRWGRLSSGKINLTVVGAGAPAASFVGGTRREDKVPQLGAPEKAHRSTQTLDEYVSTCVNFRGTDSGLHRI